MAKSGVMHRINVYQIETKIGEKSMVDYAFYNGVFTPYDACCVPISDRSIFFGEAVYDVILGRDGRPYQLDEHLDRLLGNAMKIGLSDIPSVEDLKESIRDLLSIAEADDFVLYAQLSSNGERRNHLRTDTTVNILLTVTETRIPDRPELCDAVLLPDLRHRYCNVKTTALLPAIISLSEAEARGSDIAIFEKDGYVTEASHANVAIIVKDKLITHPLDESILPGISQMNLIRVCKSLGICNEERQFTVREMIEADLVLITSTTKLVKACRKINGVELSSDKLDLASEIFNRMRGDIFTEF